MQAKKKTLPSRQARERVCKSNSIVTQKAVGGLLLIVFVVFAVMVAPHLLYDYLAPLKGWC